MEYIMKIKKNKIVIICCKMHFNAAHRLHNPQFSDEKNRKIFGPCNNQHGHGHNYTIEVCVKGPIDESTGYVIDLRKLKSIVEEEIIQYCDHKHLNYDVPWLKDVIPTAENLVTVFWERLEDKFFESKLYKIRLEETERNIAEYFGE